MLWRDAQGWQSPPKVADIVQKSSVHCVLQTANCAVIRRLKVKAADAGGRLRVRQNLFCICVAKGVGWPYLLTEQTHIFPTFNLVLIEKAKFLLRFVLCCRRQG